MVSPGILGCGQPYLSRREEARDVRRVGHEQLVLGADHSRKRLVERDDALPQAPRRHGACADVRERPKMCLGRVAARITVEERFARAPADEQRIPLVEEAGAWRAGGSLSLQLEQASALADLRCDRGE